MAASNRAISGARFALVTKSYKGDIEPFAKLCASVDRHMPQVTHYVLIDKTDIPLFARFATAQRVLVDCAALLPQFREIEAMGRRLWWRAPFRIVRGWIYQQLAKIAFVATLQHEAAVLIDSDAVFIAPLRDEHVFDGAATRMFHNPGQASGSEFQKWHNVALGVLGLPQAGYSGCDYISQAVIWSPDIVGQMIAVIERTTGKRWFDALISNFRFSEYILYGIYCDHVDGPHRQRVVPTTDELCHCSWHYDIATTDGVNHFVESLATHQVAVLVQSNLALASTKRDDIFRRFGA